LESQRKKLQKKFEELQKHGDIDGALALFGGWTGIDLSQYDDDQELRHVESNAIRSAVESWSKSSPTVKKWTKETVAKHITVGGLGATVVGTAKQVADEFERWVEEADVDGFNIAYALKPGTFVDVAELLLPELRRRGLFWDDYVVEGGAYRENIYGVEGLRHPPADHPAARYQWRAGVAVKDHTIPPEPYSNGSVKRPLDEAKESGVQKRRKSARIAST